MRVREQNSRLFEKFQDYFIYNNNFILFMLIWIDDISLEQL